MKKVGDIKVVDNLTERITDMFEWYEGERH